MSDLEDYLAVQNTEASYFNELVKACGYHVSLVRNLLLVAFMLALIVLVWIISIVRDKIIKKSNKRKREPFWSNFMLRFVYEVFFQLVIGVTIFLAASADSSENFSKSSLFIAIAALLASLTIFALLVCSCFKDGPQILGSYESISSSFWHFRTLKPLPEVPISKDKQV